jgi:hypothetical protein
MSNRNEIHLSAPVEVLGVLVDGHIAYGQDHVLGYFIQGFDTDGECVLDRDQMGCGCVPCPNANVPLTTAEYYAALYVFFRVWSYYHSAFTSG